MLGAIHTYITHSLFAIYVERDEFRLAIQQATSDWSVPEIDALFDQLDWTGKGNISYLAFLAACIEGHDVSVSDFENVSCNLPFLLFRSHVYLWFWFHLYVPKGFRVLDRDRKGILTRADLRRALYTVSSFELLSPSDMGQPSHSFAGLRITQLIERVFQASDLNEDNTLSYAEYLFALSDSKMVGNYSQSVKNLLTPDLLTSAPPSAPLLRHLPSHKLSSLYGAANNIQTRRQVSI
ncbi:EF-hand domain-containing protein [archaeon]|nr:MAG: EF-hand domain-containing protein [archaeon]